MRGLGFGLERIGILAMRQPLVFTVFILAVTLLALVYVPAVKFNGNVTSVIPQTSENYINFENQKADFRNFSRDVAVVIKSPRIKTASGLEDLRFMQLELAITDGVASAVSLFSIPDPDPQSGELRQFFPNTIENDEQAALLLDRLEAQYPQAKSLISAEENAALLIVALDLAPEIGNDRRSYEAFSKIRAAVEDVAPDDFKLYYSGLTPIGLTILETLVSDQLRLTIVGLAIGAFIAMIFFRSLVAAFVCFLPPLLTAVWSIGLFSIAGVPITYLTTILPALALVLAYADSIVLYHRWSKLNAQSNDADNGVLKSNLRDAVLRIGPASALTSITTAFAISSFTMSDSEALIEFGWLGVLLVIFAFTAVIIVVPLLGLLLIRFGVIGSGKAVRRRYSFGRIAVNCYSASPSGICIGGVLASVAMIYVHFALEPNYNIVDYLPHDSDTLEAERLSNKIFGGQSLIFLSVPVAEDGGISSAENRKRLAEITTVLETRFEPSQIFSLHALWHGYSEEVQGKIARQLVDAESDARQGYLSKDRQKMLVSVRLPSDRSIRQLGDTTNEIRSLINDQLAYGDDIVLTGFPVLLSMEFTKLIDELRTSLLVAVLLGVVLIGIATRSFFFALVAAVPNLLPILLIETFLYFKSGFINVTEVVALTLAFGVAIDNAVHIINVFHFERNEGADTRTALAKSIIEVAPALGASTLIICISNLAILFSVLPILPIIGKLIIAILIIALFTNLIILPANILTLRRVFSRRS